MSVVLFTDWMTLLYTGVYSVYFRLCQVFGIIFLNWPVTKLFNITDKVKQVAHCKNILQLVHLCFDQLFPQFIILTPQRNILNYCSILLGESITLWSHLTIQTDFLPLYHCIPLCAGQPKKGLFTTESFFLKSHWKEILSFNQSIPIESM